MTELPEDVEIEFSLRPDPDEELGQYVLHFEGTARAWDNEQGADLAIARIRGQRLDLATANHDRVDPQTLFQSVSPEIADFAENVLGDRTCLIPFDQTQGIERIECACIVYIAELRVEPGHRSQGIGSGLLRRMGAIIDINDCLIALKAFPLAEELGKPAPAEDLGRVERFYTRHGFVEAGNHFMVKDARLCEAMKKRLAARRPPEADPT